MQEYLLNYLKSAQKSIDSILKSAQNVWSHPNCPQNLCISFSKVHKHLQTTIKVLKTYRYHSQKCTKNLQSYAKSARKPVGIILKSAQNLQTVLKVHKIYRNHCQKCTKIWRYKFKKCTKIFWNYPKSGQNATEIILKSAQKSLKLS